MIQAMTYGVVFFGVPHQGSKKVSWGSIVAGIACSFGGRINQSFMQGVESGSSYNERLNERFAPLLAKYKFLSVCEMLEEIKCGVNLGIVSVESIITPLSIFKVLTKDRLWERNPRFLAFLIRKKSKFIQIEVTVPFANLMGTEILFGSKCQIFSTMASCQRSTIPVITRHLAEKQET
jgi:hypothetical protein